MQRFGCSQRNALRVMKMSASTYLYKPVKKDESALKMRIKEITDTRVHYGDRRVHVLLRREGHTDIVKRIYRLYREEGLSLRLKRPQDPEIMLGVLQIVFSQDPVAGRTGVACQLLVAFIDGLGIAPNLDVLGPLRVPGAVGVGAVGVAAIAAGLSVASALTLHALEISHRTLPCWGASGPQGRDRLAGFVVPFTRGRSPVRNARKNRVSPARSPVRASPGRAVLRPGRAR